MVFAFADDAEQVGKTGGGGAAIVCLVRLHMGVVVVKAKG